MELLRLNITIADGCSGDKPEHANEAAVKEFLGWSLSTVPIQIHQDLWTQSSCCCHECYRGVGVCWYKWCVLMSTPHGGLNSWPYHKHFTKNTFQQPISPKTLKVNAMTQKIHASKLLTHLCQKHHCRYHHTSTCCWTKLALKTSPVRPTSGMA